MSAQSDLLPEKDVIAGMTDEGMLNAYHSAAYDMSDDIVARIEMFRLAGTASEDWLRRAASKAAYAKIVMKRVERRLVELGLDSPVTRDGREREIIRKLASENRELRKALRESERPGSDCQSETKE